MNDIADDCIDAILTMPENLCPQQQVSVALDDVTDFIPHSGSMALLDRIVNFDDQGLTAELVVRGDGLFGDDQSVPAWAGIEYMAQTVAAYVGVKARQANEPIRMGFLLGTRRYSSNVAAFKVGAVLTIRVEKIIQDDGLGVFDCRIEGENIKVTANLNVYQPPLDKALIKNIAS